MTGELEIACDASIKTINGVTFGCAGAINMNNENNRYIQILPNVTNNRAELIAIYLAVLLAHFNQNLITTNYTGVTIYSDSKISVFGLREWICDWINHIDINGNLRSKEGKLIANQDVIIMIFNYMAAYNLRFRLMHCKGHINSKHAKSIDYASNIFAKQNSIIYPKEKIERISYYNDKIDVLTKQALNSINPNDYINDKEYSPETLKNYGFVLPRNPNLYFI